MSDELGQVWRDVPLGPRTTLELGGAAEYFVEVRSELQLVTALAWARRSSHQVSILGGGSNVVVPDEGVEGLVIQMANQGIEVNREAGSVHLKVAAGESWDALVTRSVEEGWAGVECLAGIPGLVGATPIQNVGAYGQEVSETIVRVGCVDRTTLQRVELRSEDCGFAYRDSEFKRAPNRFVVTDVTFELRPGGAPALRYAELVQNVSADASLQQVRDTVLSLRRRKSMVLDAEDPNRRSAGSFFTNPIVENARADEVERRAHELNLGAVPRWAVDEARAKLAAGWLIEKSGFARGARRGSVGSSSKHALALINRGGATTAELLAFAAEVQAAVEARFGVRLEREPRLLGE